MLVVNIEGKKSTFELHQRLATKIVEMIKEQGSCKPEDLMGSDFSCEEVKKSWCIARSLAEVELYWLETLKNPHPQHEENALVA